MTWRGYWRNFIRTNMGKYLDNWMGLISVVSTPIYAGQRQGCVLSPHFSALYFKRAYGNGGEEWDNMGIDLRDGMPHLLDLKCGHDINLILFYFSACDGFRNFDLPIGHVG